MEPDALYTSDDEPMMFNMHLYYPLPVVLMFKRTLSISLLMALSVTLLACGDDAASNNTTNNRVDPNNVPVPAGSQLLHTGGCAGQANCGLDITFSSEGPLRVQLIDGNSNAIAGAAIEYELDASDSADSTLNASSARTDAEGFAQVLLRAGTTTGVVNVTASVKGDTAVNPIQFVAGINSKDSASYRVSFTHDYPANIKDVDVFLFASTVTCDEVRADWSPDTPAVLTAEATAQGLVNVDGTLPLVTFPGLMNGSSFTVGARAKSRDNSEVELSMGCTDGNPAIEAGNSVDVLVDLADHLPRVKGEYEVVHTFRIADAVCMPQQDGTYSGALPEGVCRAVDLVGRLATDPASFLLGTGAADTGVLSLILDYLPEGDFKDRVQSFLDNGLVNSIGRDALNGFLKTWLDANAPSWLNSSLDVTTDIYESLQEFRVAGLIRIKSEAVLAEENGQVVGLLEADTNGELPGEQVWEDIIVFWKGDCADDAPPACRERTLGASNLGGNNTIVEGDFTGKVVVVDDAENPGFGLQIDPHSLTLNYGELILAILEKVIFPSIFGPNVDSIEEVIDTILQAAVGGADGCQGLADFVTTNVGGGANVNSIVNNLCGSLVTEASDGIRAYLGETLVLDGGDSFVLSTPADKPCRVYEPELYSGDWIGKPLPYVNALGTESMECVWDVKIAAGGTSIEFEAPFNGTRAIF